MELDNSWSALLRPGKATRYFDMLGRDDFQAGGASYSRANAWWLSELSRLIYKQEPDETGDRAATLTRNQVLNEVNLDEVHFISERGTQYAVIQSRSAITVETFAVLVFRGTHDLQDWLTNLNTVPARWSGNGRVHKGFRDALVGVWKKIEERLDALRCPIFYTGHSLGAALATLAASLRPPRGLYTFGSPLVGDEAFAETLRGTNVYRVVHHRDMVTNVPPPVLGFCPVGELRYITHDGRMLVNPPAGTIAADRMKTTPSFRDTRGWFNRLMGPPEFLADHAPVNYVARLERCL